MLFLTFLLVNVYTTFDFRPTFFKSWNLAGKRDAVVLVTGGCGYVGTHTVVRLLEGNVDVVVIDNMATLEPSPINGTSIQDYLMQLFVSRPFKKCVE